jgi:hypothetical protein
VADTTDELDQIDLSKVLDDINAVEMPSEEKLSRLSKLCRDQLIVMSDIEELEKQLTVKKEALKQISEYDIPDLFDELGIDEFRLKSGVRVTIAPYYSGKVDSPEAYEWLDDNGHGDIIKGQLSIPYPRGFDQSKLVRITQIAKDIGLVPDNEESVHHSTMKAWVKDMVKKGEEFPRELFNVHVGRKTKLSIK